MVALEARKGCMGILGWLEKRADNSVLDMCHKTLTMNVAFCEEDEDYNELISSAVWRCFESMFNEKIDDPIEFIIRIKSRLESQGSNSAADLSNKILKIAASKKVSSPIVGEATKLIASWLQLI